MSEDLVQSLEEVAAHMVAMVGWDLRQPKEVIYEDVHIHQ